MKKKLFYWLCLMCFCSSNIHAQTKASVPNPFTTSAVLLARYLGDTIIEKVSYDESHEQYVRLPEGFDIKKIHFLDMPYIKHKIEKSHVEEVLTSKGVCAKLITYFDRNAEPDGTAQVKYRIVLNDRVISLDEYERIIVETMGTEEYKTTMVQKGVKALEQGIFKPITFAEMDVAAIASFEKQGFKMRIENGSILFSNLSKELELEYNSKQLFYGERRVVNGKLTATYHFFKKDSLGYIVPKNQHTFYDDQLPTGVKVKRSVYNIISNFKVEGKRYNSLYASTSTNYNNELNIIPNPINGQLLRGETSLADLEDENTIKAQVIDIAGRIVLTNVGKISTRVFELDITTLPAGLYVLRLDRGNISQISKFIKK